MNNLTLAPSKAIIGLLLCFALAACGNGGASREGQALASVNGAEISATQREKFLLAKRTREAAEAELARLRSLAHIAYLNKGMASTAVAAGAASGHADPANVRGGEGLK